MTNFWFDESMTQEAIAVLQLLYAETIALKWLFPQEKATFQNAGECIGIGEPL
jgi:hypothetical protein